MKNFTPFIDNEGNMRLHAREGGVVVLDFQEDDGSPRDVTAASIYFEIQNFRKALGAGETPSQRTLVIERGELNQFFGKVTPFIFLDETGEIPHVIIEGKCIVTGWI